MTPLLTASGFLSAVKDWQDLITGVLVFGGAVGAIWYAAVSDQRREKEEARALRRALGIELRDMAANVLRVYQALEPLPGNSFSIVIGDLVNLVRFVEPVVCKSTAGSISVLGE